MIRAAIPNALAYAKAIALITCGYLIGCFYSGIVIGLKAVIS